MSKALTKSSRGSVADGAVPAVCSAVIPGVGQLVNRESDKALGMFAVWAVTGASFVAGLPLVGGVFGLVSGATWLYSIGDGYFKGRKKG